MLEVSWAQPRSRQDPVIYGMSAVQFIALAAPVPDGEATDNNRRLEPAAAMRLPIWNNPGKDD